MIVLVFTSPNVCFCITWKNMNRRNGIKMQYFVDFVAPGRAKADSHLITSCVRNIGVKRY